MIHTTAGIGMLSCALLCGCANGSTAAPTAPVEVSFDNPLNLIVVEATIRGEGPFRFALDSGASGTVLDPAVAETVGLRTTQARQGRGTAEGSRVTAASVKDAVEFVLADGLTAEIGQVITAPFTNTAWIMLGESLHGILGSEVFRQYVIEVDYARQTLVFHDPAEYEYRGDGAILDLDFPSYMPKLPFINASLINGDRRLTDFPILVDSGGQTMGTASVPNRKDWDALIEPSSRIIDAMGATGLSDDAKGTTHEAFVTRMDRLVLGPFEFGGPLVSYSAGGPKIAVMGATLLHRFTAVFDYSRQRLILEPNAHFSDPPLMDKSGVMMVMWDGGEPAFEVFFVASQTPAHEAGLTKGDVIVAVDGVPVEDITLTEARLLFCQERAFELQVRRQGEPTTVTLKTRSFYE